MKYRWKIDIRKNSILILYHNFIILNFGNTKNNLMIIWITFKWLKTSKIRFISEWLKINVDFGFMTWSALCPTKKRRWNRSKIYEHQFPIKRAQMRINVRNTAFVTQKCQERSFISKISYWYNRYWWKRITYRAYSDLLHFYEHRNLSTNRVPKKKASER